MTVSKEAFLSALSRRHLLTAAAMSAGSAVFLAACGGTGTAVSTGAATTATAPPAPTVAVSSTTSASPSLASSTASQATATSSPTSSTAAQTTVVSSTGSAQIGAPASTTASAVVSSPGPTTNSTVATGAKSAIQVEFWTNPSYAYTGHIGEQLVKEFQQANPGVTINFEDNAIGNSSHAVKLLAAAAAGTPPDMSYLDRFNTKSFSCRGIAGALDRYMKTAKNARIDSFWPRLQYDISYQGKVWAVPHGPVVGLLYYNRDVFKEVGLDPDKPPTTWDETLAAIPRLVQRTGNSTTRVGWAPVRGFGVPWLVPYWQLGADLTSSDEKQATFNNDQATQVFDWILKVDDPQGGEAPLNDAFQKANAFDAFAQSKTAMVWAAHTQYAISWEKLPNLNVGFSYWPTPPTGSRSNYMGGWSLVIPVGAKHADAAFSFLDYLSADDPQIRWANEWNTVPTTQNAATSDRYIQNRQDRKLAVGDMPTAKWVITAPGGDTALAPTQAVSANIVDKRLNVRDSLAQAQQQVQQDLNDAQRSCVS